MQPETTARERDPTQRPSWFSRSKCYLSPIILWTRQHAWTWIRRIRPILERCLRYSHQLH